MFQFLTWLTISVREAFLKGVREGVEVMKTGNPGDSPEAQRLLELTGGQLAHEPLNRLSEFETNGSGKRAKARV